MPSSSRRARGNQAVQHMRVAVMIAQPAGQGRTCRHACMSASRRHPGPAANSPPLHPLPHPLQGSTAGVGSVIKCGAKDSPIGVSTVLNLQRHGRAKPLQELRAFLLAGAGDCRQRLEQVRAGATHAIKAQCMQPSSSRNGGRRAACLSLLPHVPLPNVHSIESPCPHLNICPRRPGVSAPSPYPCLQAWAAPGTGLVVNERLVNCPPQLAEPLQESLFGDVEEAAGDPELPQVGRRAVGWAAGWLGGEVDVWAGRKPA